MKSLIKKTAVFVFALALMVSTASTVLATGSHPGDEPGPTNPTPPGWGGGGGPNS